ncbi:hypothetical protein GDO86_004137 [Hymenochirus boettgeri]|uniref:Uncharacterized protein n=1 Tax=Hymenochirus boettgeri TaxID=247094 RepID=A0A8T2K7P6_9PIPI|nr:hypothetical protein GDO86_004137 [Hymenochirus boettgeri]
MRECGECVWGCVCEESGVRRVVCGAECGVVAKCVWGGVCVWKGVTRVCVCERECVVVRESGVVRESVLCVRRECVCEREWVVSAEMCVSAWCVRSCCWVCVVGVVCGVCDVCARGRVVCAPRVCRECCTGFLGAVAWGVCCGVV